MNGFLPTPAFALTSLINLSLATALGWLADNAHLLRAEVAQKVEVQRLLEELNSDLEQRVEIASEELKRAYEALQFQNQSLEETVQARTVDLRATVDDLEWLIAMIGHDVRSPLRNVSRYAEQLAESESIRANAQDRHAIDRIQLRTRELSSLLEGLVLVSRSRFESPEVADVDVSELVGPLVSQASDRTGKDILLDEDLPPVRANKILLRQVLANAIDNAVRHGSGQVRIVADHSEEDAQIVILDEGVSASKDPGIINQLEPFTPGLGLRIATKLTERMGGSFVMQRLSTGHTEARIRLRRAKFAPQPTATVAISE